MVGKTKTGCLSDVETWRAWNRFIARFMSTSLRTISPELLCDLAVSELRRLFW